MFDFTEEELNRYSRHILLQDVGVEGQEKIREGKVLVIGAGGLGAPVAMYLAAAGVGTIGIVDGDVVDLSNLLQALSLKEPNIGTMRETFFCNQLGYKHQVEYCKNGDFLIDHKLTFEIGGKAKDGKQVAQTENAYIAADDYDYPNGNKLPLWLIGFLY